jgi:NADH-quinone oxidoreductase subunit C
MNHSPEHLSRLLTEHLGERIDGPRVSFGEVAVDVSAAQYHAVLRQLRDEPVLHFEQLIDLGGIDYATFNGHVGRRFAVTLQLLSVSHNWRLRVRVFADDDEFPVLPSITDIWAAANWYEREAFDFYGIHFDGHDDLRRLLTDYGFVGHPFRKDFPISGHVEMRYDAELKRVAYQPVSIEPREVTPRIVRELHYGRDADHG